jgi:hypothetical protein
MHEKEIQEEDFVKEYGRDGITELPSALVKLDKHLIHEKEIQEEDFVKEYGRDGITEPIIINLRYSHVPQ